VAAPVEGASLSERRQADAEPGAQGRPADSGTERGGAADDLRPAPLPAAAARWAQCAINGDPGELTNLHDALRKALVYLGRHYDQAISLEQLARQAHVSPSHLSFLFRSVLQTSFKPLLQWIRIQQARQMLLADQRQRITDVALMVGFADLSHFEKSFRRIVGQSPRDYRRKAQACSRGFRVGSAAASGPRRCASAGRRGWGSARRCPGSDRRPRRSAPAVRTSRPDRPRRGPGS